MIRETSEKSFRTFLSLIEDNYNEIFIIDKNKAILYANKAFEDSMAQLIGDRNPTYLKEFVHENSIDALENQVGICIKEQKKFITNIFLIKRFQSKSATHMSESSPYSSSGKTNLDIYCCCTISKLKDFCYPSLSYSHEFFK